MKKHENRIKLSIQMFNFIAGGDWENVHSTEDAETILSRLSDAGYNGIEWCDFQFRNNELDVCSIKQIMDRLGLESSGLHFHQKSEDSLEDDCLAAAERCHILGADKLIYAYSLPSMFGIEPDGEGKYTPAQIDSWAEKADLVMNKLRKAVEKVCPDAGIKILYHNHNTELLKGTGGRYFLDMIHPDGKEADIYWVAKGLDGKVSSAAEYVRSIKNEVMLMHVKDGLNGSVFSGEMCGWGKGTYPLQDIADLAGEIGLDWIVVENDAPKNFGMTGIEDALQSAEYAFKNMIF